MENLDSPGSVFRMNHASNYLVLKGTLNQDQEAMLRTMTRRSTTSAACGRRPGGAFENQAASEN